MDIFNPANPDSLTRRIIGTGYVSVRSAVSPYTIPKGVDVKDFFISGRDEIDSITDIVTAPSIRNGYPKDIERYLHEAVLNAFQHGNRKDPEKMVRIGYDENANFSVLDEGKYIRSEFIPFVLALREGMKVKSFYAFAGIERNTENFGLGTIYMNRRFNLSYYHGELGGLAVVMRPKETPRIIQHT